LRSQLGNLATFFNYRLDVFIVNYFLSPTQVGLYAVGVLVSESLWQIPDAAALALLPRIAGNLDKESPAFTCQVLHQISLIVLVSGIAVATLSPALIPLLFGAKFAASVPVVWWILPGTMALAVGKVMSAALTAKGMPEYSSIFALVALIVTVILDLKLIPRMGIRGAALASSAAYLVDAGLVAWILKLKLNVSWKDLYVPMPVEFSLYQQAWNRCMTRLRLSLSA
jgi:O-antigen/teichoic acid export membrane protein